MEKYAWKANIKEGCLEEYIKRHDQIWPEMKDLLKKAGIKNYTIWNTGTELFGYYECEFGAEFAAKVQNERTHYYVINNYFMVFNEFWMGKWKLWNA